MCAIMARRDYDAEYRKERAAVMKRDGHKCAKCGTRFSLEVHHVNGHEQNSGSDLITLCFLCHGIAPMGAEFDEWFKSGKDGIEALGESLKIQGNGIEREYLAALLEQLDAYLRGIRKHQLTTARALRRARLGRCEGVKPFGTFAGENEGLCLIESLRKQGKNGREIADELNARHVPTRSAKPWHDSVVRKILARLKNAGAPLQELNSAPNQEVTW